MSAPERYKYIRYFDDRTLPVPSNVDDLPAKDLLVAAGWLDRPVEREQLYDLWLDPLERVNLIADPNYAAARADLERRLEDWMRATVDPLLLGPVPKPAGAVVNTRDTLSPSSGEYE